MEKFKAIFPVTRAFALALLILATVAGLSYRNALVLIESSRSEDLSQDFILGLDQLLSTLTEKEGDQRVSLVSGDPNYLPSQQKELDTIAARLNALKPLTESNPERQKRWREIEGLLSARVAEVQQTLARRQALGGGDPGRARFYKEMHTLVTGLRTKESQLMHDRTQEKAARTRGLTTTIMGGYLLSFTILFLVFLVLRKEIKQRAKAEASLLTHQGDLERTVAQRTRELAWANNSLQRENEERRQAEAMLAEAQRIANIGSWEWDVPLGKVMWSDQMFRIFDEERSTFVPTHDVFLHRVHPEDRQRTDAVIGEALAEGTRYSVEYRIVTRQGATRAVLAQAEVMLADDGRPRHVVGTVLDITTNKEAESRIQAALHEKEVLLKEIHHRVKNNLQVITSLVDLQADALDNPDLAGLFQDIRDRVRSMALVHEMLYQSENLARVEFGEYIRSLLHSLWRTHGSSASSIQLTLELQPLSLSVETAVPCGLIVNELAVNALKHAFRDRVDGEVVVALAIDQDGQVSIRVSDNGVGLPSDLDWRQSRSLGLRLVAMLTRQLNGAMEVVNGAGTEFRITFGCR